MKASLGALLCLVATACSQDKPAATAEDWSARNEGAAVDEEGHALTPASGSMSESRQRPAADTSPHHSPASVPAAERESEPRESVRPARDPDVADDDPAERSSDNTAVNERDRDDASLTPPDQRENQSDLDITQRIRQAVMADDSLSFTAKNVKIITAGGKVTLRGPVKSDAERSAIEAAARRVAGVKQVDNQIEVKK